MTDFNIKRASRFAALCLSLWLAGGGLVPLAAAPKGNAIFKQGRKAELSKDYDKALELYERALREDPENQTYMLATRRMRFVAGQTHVDQGHRLLDQGKLVEAAAEFEKANTIDPSLTIAQQELKRTLDLIAKREQEQKQKEGQNQPGGGAGAAQPAKPGGAGAAEAQKPEPGLSPLLEAKKETEELLESAQPVPTLRPLSTQPINFKASNNSKVIFETIGKLAGINVLFDPEMQGRRITVEINNATLLQALDYVATISKAYWKPLSANAIFVTDDNTTKRRDYEDYVVRTFYLSNVYTAQELQEIATAVRSVTEIRRVFTINSLNALVIRGTADQLALAEKVIDDVDKSRGEVIIDVLVLETSRTTARDLGLTPVSGTTPGINVSVAPVSGSVTTGTSTGTTGTTTTGTTTTGTTTPTTGTAGTTTTPAAGTYTFGHLQGNSFSLSLPSANLKALMSASDTRILQSPRVRGFDGYKTSLRIGQRIPIATGSFQPGIGGVGINPLVNTQFNYQDVGVNVDLTPRVHYGREVSMHIEIEISTVADHVDIGGISQPVIGQRKIIHDLRLKEGESSIIGGLNQTQVTRTVAGVPGLMQIPVLGRLFSNEHKEVSDQEILIVLTPHVVRVPELTDLNMKGISAGTDQIVRLNFAPPPNDGPALPPLPPPGGTAPAGAPAPATPGAAPAAPAVPTAPAAPAGAPAQPTVPPPVPGAAIAPTPPPGPGGPGPRPVTPGAAQPAAPRGAEAAAPRLRFESAQVSGAMGTRITLNLLAENVTDLFAAPVRVTFNPKQLSLVDVRRGGLLASDGQDIIFSRNIQNDSGEASINLSRFPGSGGVSGSGSLLTLEFQPVAAGSSTVSVTGAGVRNARQEAITLGGAQAEVVVR
jgi:general secretion pathway protein D